MYTLKYIKKKNNYEIHKAINNVFQFQIPLFRQHQHLDNLDHTLQQLVDLIIFHPQTKLNLPIITLKSISEKYSFIKIFLRYFIFTFFILTKFKNKCFDSNMYTIYLTK